MKTNNFRYRILLILSIYGIFGLPAIASSQTAGKNQTPEPPTVKTGEMHRKMATLHLKMADCLESGKSFANCRQEMMDSCSASFGGNCPMNWRGMMGGGMMGGGYCVDWMQDSESKIPKTTPKTPAK